MRGKKGLKGGKQVEREVEEKNYSNRLNALVSCGLLECPTDHNQLAQQHSTWHCSDTSALQQNQHCNIISTATSSALQHHQHCKNICTATASALQQHQHCNNISTATTSALQQHQSHDHHKITNLLPRFTLSCFSAASVDRTDRKKQISVKNRIGAKDGFQQKSFWKKTLGPSYFLIW